MGVGWKIGGLIWGAVVAAILYVGSIMLRYQLLIGDPLQNLSILPRYQQYFKRNEAESTRMLTKDTDQVFPPSVLSKEELWFQKVSSKINCLKSQHGYIFFYHTRKAGGTTIHDWLTIMANSWHIRYLDLEGKSLNPTLLQEKSVLSFTSLRDPIDRILSLYWYEHVAWWYDIKHEPANCRTLAQWVDGWRDGSSWKSRFVQHNPGTVYVEVENYYVKSFIGWTGDHQIGENDLEQAKRIIAEQFDLIIMMDEMSDDNLGSMAILTKLFGGSTKVLRQKNNKFDQSTRQKLENTLASDQITIIQLLTHLNKYDIQLFNYAKELVQGRTKYLSSIVGLSHKKDCPSSGNLQAKYRENLGLFRPIGHKGPLDNFPGR